MKVTYNKAYIKRELLNSRAYLIGVSWFDTGYINQQLDSLNRGADPLTVANNLISKFPAGLAEGHVKSILSSAKGISTGDSIPRSPELQAISRRFAAALRPISGAIDVLPVEPALKRAFKEDPLGLIWDFVQYGRDRIVDVFNRVARRSGKTYRNVGGRQIKMTADKNTPIAVLVAQLLILITTEWWALHDEFLRQSLGQPIGQRGPLGNYSRDGLGVEPTSAAAGGGGAAVVIFGIGLDVWLTILGAISAILGVLSPIILSLIDWGKTATTGGATTSGGANLSPFLNSGSSGGSSGGSTPPEQKPASSSSGGLGIILVAAALAALLLVKK